MTCRSLASTSGSTPTTSSIRTVGPTTSRRGGTSSTGRPSRSSTTRRWRPKRAAAPDRSVLAANYGLGAAPRLEVARSNLILRDEDADRPAAARHELADGPDRHYPARPRAERQPADVHPRVQQREPLQVDGVPGERGRRRDIEVKVPGTRRSRELYHRRDLHDHRALRRAPLRLIRR